MKFAVTFIFLFAVLVAASFAAEDEGAVDSLAPKKTEKRGILGYGYGHGIGHGHYGHLSPYYGGYYGHGYELGHGYPYAYSHHQGYLGYPHLYGGHGHFY